MAGRRPGLAGAAPKSAARARSIAPPGLDALRANECLPLIAAGNEGEGSTRSPGNDVQALSVGATGPTARIPVFSGSELMLRDQDSIVPDIVAPGVDIWSAAPGGGFQLMQGTSMAAPHVSGLAALLFEKRPM